MSSHCLDTGIELTEFLQRKNNTPYWNGQVVSNKIDCTLGFSLYQLVSNANDMSQERKVSLNIICKDLICIN